MRRALSLALCLPLAACSRPTDPQRPAQPSEARDVPALQGDRDAARDVRDVPAAPAATTSLRATATGESANPPLREFDPTLPVPRWSGQGQLTVELPGADGPCLGTLRVGDLSLRLRGYRAGDTVRGALEPESVDDGGAWVWRGLLDARVEGGALRGTWSVSAHGGRYARAGIVGAR